MLSTWTRTVLLLYMANELQGFVPAPAEKWSTRENKNLGSKIKASFVCVDGGQ